MPLFSFHLVEAGLVATARALLHPHTSDKAPGLIHAECLTPMRLGTPILSPARVRFRQLAVFAAWQDGHALESWLADTDLGQTLAKGWHVRMELIRRWGSLSQLDQLPIEDRAPDPTAPVVAVTLARLRLTQVPRFIRWGKPVESLVRDHPGVALALAAMRPARTVSTFTVWRSQEHMRDMVHGQGAIANPTRHAVAMVERERKDFHHEFTTLRFRAIEEHGEWQGQGSLIPGLP